MRFLFIIAIKLVILTSFLACKAQNVKNSANNDLVEIKRVTLQVSEPSGLCFTVERDGFWVVSDHVNKIYRLDNYGKVTQTIAVTAKDLEGVAIIDSNKIAVVGEKDSEVIILNLNGEILKSEKISIDDNEDSGLEGISYDPYRKIFYLLKEKKPGLLIKTDENFNEIERIKLDFAKDYSDIFYDGEKQELWIVSDESKMVFNTDLDGKVIRKFSNKIVQQEGICVDVLNNRLFIVSDSREELYVFELE